MKGVESERIRDKRKKITSNIKGKLEKWMMKSVNLLNLMWKKDVFTVVIDNFQQLEFGLEKPPKYRMWIKLLSVLLKKSFLNCTSFSEL